jgi:feruloyl esterase
MACGRLAGLALRDTIISIATVVPAGTFTPPPQAFMPPPLPIDTTACRVVGSIKPTHDSDITFELWMPVTGWNGKFLSAGEGGFAGVINYGGVSDALRLGYAGGSTDTGHIGGTADFAPGHPEKVIDFGWRAKHLQAERSKDLIRAFYGEPIKHSYYSDCSNGGREGLMEAQRFAEDFDGVLVGAPANDWTHLMAAAVWNEQALSRPGAFVDPAKLAAVEAATLAACDALDGVTDGVVDDPRRCIFDPATLACPIGVDNERCLTPPQVTAIRAILAGATNPRTGRRIFPGWFTSAAGESDAWPLWITGFPAPGTPVGAVIGNEFFGRIIHEIPAPGVWDFSTFNFDSDVAAADAKAAFTFNATDTNLTAFRVRNPRGKMILWHGWDDPAISAVSTVNYFQRMVRETADARAFVRLFMVPGMLHCGGGPGPNSFGQALPQATPLSHRPEDDVLSALDQWVEHGVAPERIVAAKYINDDPTEGIERTRPLCAFPNRAVYDGRGSTDDAANFTCRAPKPAHDDQGDGL